MSEWILVLLFSSFGAVNAIHSQVITGFDTKNECEAAGIIVAQSSKSVKVGTSCVARPWAKLRAAVLPPLKKTFLSSEDGAENKWVSTSDLDEEIAAADKKVRESLSAKGRIAGVRK